MPIEVFGVCYETFAIAKAAIKTKLGYSDKRAAATVAKFSKEGCRKRK